MPVPHPSGEPVLNRRKLLLLICHMTVGAGDYVRWGSLWKHIEHDKASYNVDRLIIIESTQHFKNVIFQINFEGAIISFKLRKLYSVLILFIQIICYIRGYITVLVISEKFRYC